MDYDSLSANELRLESARLHEEFYALKAKMAVVQAAWQAAEVKEQKAYEAANPPTEPVAPSQTVVPAPIHSDEAVNDYGLKAKVRKIWIALKS